MKNKTDKNIIATIINTIDKSTSRVIINDKVYNTKYSKYYKHSRKLLVDNNTFSVQVNDIVSIISTRPLSKNKSWMICEKPKSIAKSTASVDENEELK